MSYIVWLRFTMNSHIWGRLGFQKKSSTFYSAKGYKASCKPPIQTYCQNWKVFTPIVNSEGDVRRQSQSGDGLMRRLKIRISSMDLLCCSLTRALFTYCAIRMMSQSHSCIFRGQEAGRTTDEIALIGRGCA